jgi:hypothetical protein
MTTPTSSLQRPKQRLEYLPEGFENLGLARDWATSSFIAWYNKEHCHSAIRYVIHRQITMRAKTLKS